MYHEIHKLQRHGFSIAKIARHLKCNCRTVSKYLKMNEQEYEQSLLDATRRDKILDHYELFVAGKLSEYQDTSTAQIHDWLKECYPDFPEVSPRTVYNFVMYIRQKHNIPLVPVIREYFPVDELPYGEQAQVDFGEYNMLQSNGKRKKVKFFAMVLSRSRMKYIWFQNVPFTSATVVEAHEKAFAFFGGIPQVIVYDQDRTIMVDENLGDVILTATFKQYTKSRHFKLHFCRKSDPQSKGKIENVVQYVKKNFLYNRPYFDLENLNEEAVAWLSRTANYLPHNYTKKSPQSEFLLEKEHLSPFVPLIIDFSDRKIYNVRKTNVILFHGNFYVLPSGTYKGEGTQVNVEEKHGIIHIYSQKQELLISHARSYLKGQRVGQVSRSRDTSKKIESLMEQALSYFTNKPLAMEYITGIKTKYPRYTRDQLLVILDTLTRGEVNYQNADNTLEFCMKNELPSASEFKDVYYCLLEDITRKSVAQETVILLNKDNLEKANETPQMSNLDDYEWIINNKF
jgi:transposase